MEYFLYSLVPLVLLLGFCCLFKSTKIKKYDYLEFLSYFEWRAGRDVKIAIETAKGGSLSYGTLYVTLRRLEEEGLVESVDTVDGSGDRIRKFKRKPGGRRSPPDEEFDPALMPSFV